MHFPTRIALLFIAACALSTGASAQKVYKCGASYSQVPCPDGVTVRADDARSPAQKAAAERTAREEATQAKQLEKARLKDEAQAIAASKPAEPKATKTGKTAETAAKKKKGKAPEYFTAKNTADAKKK